MKYQSLVTLPLIALVAACGGGNSSSPDAGGADVFLNDEPITENANTPNTTTSDGIQTNQSRINDMEFDFSTFVENGLLGFGFGFDVTAIIEVVENRGSFSIEGPTIFPTDGTCLKISLDFSDAFFSYLEQGVQSSAELVARNVVVDELSFLSRQEFSYSELNQSMIESGALNNLSTADVPSDTICFFGNLSEGVQFETIYGNFELNTSDGRTLLGLFEAYL